MKEKILVTDSLFILPEHEARLRDAGYEVERLDKVQASEDELVEAIKGKVGYILGGIERPTNKVIDAGDMLRAISFTGIAYRDFITNYEYVTEKGIAISNTPEGPTHSVAEWAITMALAMNRNIFDLGRTGKKDFMTSHGLAGSNIGVVGLGRIGREIIKMLKVFEPAQISYFSKHRHEDYEKELGIDYNELGNLIPQCDIIFVCVPKDSGDNLIGKNELALMKDNSLIVSFSTEGVINDEALFEKLKNGRIRAALDHPIKNEGVKDIPLNILYCSNAQTAFNTTAGIKLMSDMATESIINLLKTGKDKNRVN